MSTKLRSKSKAEFELQNLMTLSHDKLTLKHRRNLSQVHPKPMEVNKRKGINQVEADDFKLDDASFKSEMEQTVFVAESFKDFGDKSKSYKSVQINEDDSNAKESQNYSNTLGLFTSRDDHHNANNSTAKNSLSYDFLDRIIKSEKESDNDYETNECFLKLKVLEFNCSLYTLISIGSGVLYYELKQYGEGFKAFKDNKQLLDASITFTLLLVSIGVILFSKDKL